MACHSVIVNLYRGVDKFWKLTREGEMLVSDLLARETTIRQRHNQNYMAPRKTLSYRAEVLWDLLLHLLKP